MLINENKLKKYKNISPDKDNQLKAYLFDLEIKSIIFPYLEKLEDTFKSYLIHEIWENFLDDKIFIEKYLQTRKQFNQEKLQELEKKYKKITPEIFFLSLTFWEAVRYFRDLKREIKEKIVNNFYFKKVSIFENWLYSIRFFRNLICHGENIFNRKYENKIKWKVLLETKLSNNNFFSYLAILEVFNQIIWNNLIYPKIAKLSNLILNKEEEWKNTLNKIIHSILINNFSKQKNSPVLGHISKTKIEGWWVLINQVYSEFIKNQPKIFQKLVNTNNKTTFQENEINQLKEIVDNLKKQWKTIVWTNGCFDIIHPGHLETFKKAKEIWDILIVWLNWDKNPYWKTKPWRPINDEIFRNKMLEWIKYVDFIYIFNDENPAKAVDVLKPDYVLKGWDYYIKEISDDFIRWLTEDSKKEKIKLFNEIVEKELVYKKNWIIDITWIYKYFIKNNLLEIAKNTKWFMPEWLVNVKNWWNVVLVPIVGNYSTSSIVEKIRPKEFFDLVMFWKKFREKFKDLSRYIEWFLIKLKINYFWVYRKYIKFEQWYIYWIEFWQNIWSEINKKRPWIIVSRTWFSKKWNNVWVIPLTTYSKNKKVYEFDVIIRPDNKNKLDTISIARCWNVLSIDKKRLKNFIWKINKNDLEKIIENIKKLL